MYINILIVIVIVYSILFYLHFHFHLCIFGELRYFIMEQLFIYCFGL